MKKTLAETPAQEEYEVQLPASVSMDHTVRVPPEMMPAEEQALQYFDYFFSNVHPYCPVINKAMAERTRLHFPIDARGHIRLLDANVGGH
jgi:hypothetical protein